MYRSLLTIRNSQFVVCTSLALVALAASAPLWGAGIVSTRGGGDSPFLLQRSHQMLVSLQAGVFPIRWMPDAAYGLGYPFFSYYAALPYYLVGLLALVGLDLLTAIKLVQTLGFVAAALAMYGWTRGLTRSRWAAWLAAVAYTVAPFHLVNVYVRGDSLSEFYAFVFYPLVLWALDRTPEVRGPISLVPAALAYAGLVLTHNISALIFTPFVILYLVIRWLGRDLDRKSLLIGHCSLFIALLLSTWFWLPVLVEKEFVQTGVLTEGYYHYTGHFRADDLVQRRFLFDYGITPGGDTPFAMGLVQALSALFGGLTLAARAFRRRCPVCTEPGRREPIAGRLQAGWWFVLVGLLLSTAMITPLSKPLWDCLPLLQFAQFPWRFLSVQALFTAAATASLVPERSAAGGSQLAIRSSQPVAIALPVALLLVVSALLPVHPERLSIGRADVTAGRLHLYELFTGNIGTTTNHEYLYQAVVPRPFTSDALIEPGAPPRAIPLDGASLEAMLVQRTPTRQVWRVWGEGGGIAFPLLYWPGWGARVDGEPVEVWPVEGSGYVALEVGAGEHTVVLHLGRTPIRAVAEAVSLLALVGLLVIVIASQVRGAKSKIRVRPEIRRRMLSLIARCFLLAGLLALGFLSLALVLSLREAPAASTDLTMDFEQMAYLHHNPEGVDFGGVARLAGYRLSAEELAPGEVLTVALDWTEVKDGYTAMVRLVSPAAVRYDVEPLAEASCEPGTTGCASLRLRLPDDIPRSIYFLQLRLFGAEGEVRVLTPRGRTRGILYLAPVRVVCGPPLLLDTPLLGPFGPDIRLHEVTVAQPAADRLSVRLAWSAARPVAANYGITLRLLDAEERAVATLDTQPGYGFLPTSLWQPDELVSDRYFLSLPEDLPAGDYHLLIALYQVVTLEPVGQARLGDFTLPLAAPFEAHRPSRIFALPSLEYPLGVDFGGEVRLAGYDIEQGQDALRLTLWWQALEAPKADYTVFVHLFDPATDTVVAQSDAMPRGGTYPTSWWASGEVVSETVTLPLAGVPPGTYRLAVGLYDWTVTRLAAVGADGERIADDRLILPVEMRVGP